MDCSDLRSGNSWAEKGLVPTAPFGQTLPCTMSSEYRSTPRMVKLLTAAYQRIKPAFSKRYARLWLILAINSLLVGAYLWSSPGQIVDVRIEAIGASYRAFVDGKLMADVSHTQLRGGGIGFTLLGRDRDRMPSLPSPSGIDWVRVTDSAGKILFEDSFGSEPSPLWRAEWGQWEAKNGVYSTPSGTGYTTTGFQPWRDYVLEAKLRNASRAEVYVRVQDADNAVGFNMQPFRFIIREDGAITEGRNLGGKELDEVETIRSLVAMVLHPYPRLAVIFAAAVLVGLLIRSAAIERWLLAAGRFILKLAVPIVLAASIGAFYLLARLNYVTLEHMPHIPDSVSYIFQAKIFASLKLFASAPPSPEHFFFKFDFTPVVDGRWFSPYPFGHPLALALGELVGAVWLVPPLLGALSILLIFKVGKNLYGVSTGLLAAPLLLFSPFFLMTASNFMSHGTAAFYLLVSLFFLTRSTQPSTQKRALCLFASGAFLGLVFNTRILAGAVLLIPFGLLFAYEFLASPGQRKRLFRQDLAFAAGFALLFLLFHLYNDARIGDFDFLGSSYAGTGEGASFGLDFFWLGGTSNSLATELQDEKLLLALFILVANGWPVTIGLLFAALPFILGTRNRWDYFLLGCVLVLAAAPIFHTFGGPISNFYGPRMWYELMPPFILLSARGVHCLIEAASSTASRIAVRLSSKGPTGTLGATGLVVYSLIIALVVMSASGWLLEKREAPWPKVLWTPNRVSNLEGFNGVDRRLLDRVEEMEIHNALVLVGPGCAWPCYGSVFWENSPDLDGDVVYARDLGPVENRPLIEYFKGRSVYIANYRSETIMPYNIDYGR